MQIIRQLTAMKQVQGQADKSVHKSGSDLVTAGQVYGRDWRHRTKGCVELPEEGPSRLISDPQVLV